MAAAHLHQRQSVLMVVFSISLVLSVCGVPLVAAVLLSSRGLQSHGTTSGHAAATAHYPDTLTGKTLPYHWGFEGVTDDLSKDAARYEEQLSTMFNSPLSEWQVLPREGYSYAARPIMVGGKEGVVGRFAYQYKTRGGRDFFEFLMTPQGQKFLDPATDDMAKARAISKTVLGPNYATVYPVAQITKLPPPSPIPAAIYQGAVHWQMCDEHELSYFSYPAHIPIEDRLPEVQKLSGVAPDYTLVFAFRVRQLDDDTIEMVSIFWNSLLQGAPVPAALQGLETPFPDFAERTKKHLAEADYPPPTGHECDSVLVEGGFGVMGDVETLISVMDSEQD